MLADRRGSQRRPNARSQGGKVCIDPNGGDSGILDEGNFGGSGAVVPIRVIVLCCQHNTIGVTLQRQGDTPQPRRRPQWKVCVVTLSLLSQNDKRVIMA